MTTVARSLHRVDRLQASEDSGTLPDGMTRRLMALAVVGVLCCSPLLAYAGPPDPTWIAGFWDGADYDDVIVRITSIRITSTAGAVESGPPWVLEPDWVPIWSVPLVDDRLTLFRAFASHQPRSPPIA